jgi:hypothetical protein
MTARKLDLRYIRAALAEYMGWIVYQSNDITHSGTWYGNKEHRCIVRWEDWKPDEDLNQMAQVEEKLMRDPELAHAYGDKIDLLIGPALKDSRGLPQISGIYGVVRALALAATITAQQRAQAACHVIVDKWQEME